MDTWQIVVAVVALICACGFMYLFGGWLRCRDERLWRDQVAARKAERAREFAARELAIGPGQIRCTGCGHVFNKRGDEDLLVEALATFQALPMAHGPPAILCDDCYRQIMGDDPPRLDNQAGA